MAAHHTASCRLRNFSFWLTRDHAPFPLRRFVGSDRGTEPACSLGLGRLQPAAVGGLGWPSCTEQPTVISAKSKFNFGGASFSSGCEESSHSYTDEFLSSSKAAGSDSLTATVTTMVSDPTRFVIADGNGGGSLSVYALGPAGTPFHLHSSWTGQASVSVSVSGQDSWSATTTDFAKTASAQLDPGQTGSQQVTSNDESTLDGTTQFNSITCFGNTYTLAASYRFGSDARSGSDVTQEQGQARATSTLTVTGTANTAMNAIKLVSVDDKDPNNPVVSITVTGSVGAITWDVDGSLTHALGILSPGTYNFRFQISKALRTRSTLSKFSDPTARPNMGMPPH